MGVVENKKLALVAGTGGIQGYILHIPGHQRTVEPPVVSSDTESFHRIHHQTHHARCVGYHPCILKTALFALDFTCWQLLFAYCIPLLVILSCYLGLLFSRISINPLFTVFRPLHVEISILHLRQSHASSNPLCPRLSKPSHPAICILHHLQIIHIASTLAPKKV